MKIIGIDISQIIYGTGVSNLTVELVDAILKIDKDNKYVLFGSSLRGFFKLREFCKKYPDAKHLIYPFPISVFEFFFHRLNLPIELFCSSIDVFHCSDWLTPRSKRAKIVVPVYDLTTKIIPSDHVIKTIVIHETRIRRAIKYSSFITFLSLSTRKDFFNFYKFDAKKTEIIYPSTNIAQVKQLSIAKIKAKFNINKPYILSVSTLQPRKNLETLVNGYNQIPNKDNNQLVIVGPQGWGTVNIVSTSNIIQTGFVTSEELVTLYRNALVFVYPSYYEGFGLPIIEAMTFGIPTICAPVSSMPEAGGNAAEYFDQSSSKDLAKKIMQLINLSPGDRKSISSKSIKNAKRFSWTTSAKKMIKIYESI